jgi:hypothetical protein
LVKRWLAKYRRSRQSLAFLAAVQRAPQDKGKFYRVAHAKRVPPSLALANQTKAHASKRFAGSLANRPHTRFFATPTYAI